MSQTIVRSISLKNGKCTMYSASSNVIPRVYYRDIDFYLTGLMIEQGKERAVKEVLRQYWNRNWIGSMNVYKASADLMNFEHPEWDGRISNEEAMERLYETYQRYRRRKKEKVVVAIRHGNYWAGNHHVAFSIPYARVYSSVYDAQISIGRKHWEEYQCVTKPYDEVKKT